ncbi:unnamed protein product [Cylicocyclus nassatus]|uniref:Uncharacterized protein n=1 Tax=Cylicocyclus nassatus TaxID=53992 RepID=A0AA36DPW6_CYLNA|nr:unnamed protein product [Cylicocyclus nassatus]
MLVSSQQDKSKIHCRGFEGAEIHVKRGKIDVDGCGSYDPVILALRRHHALGDLQLPGLENKENHQPETSYFEAVARGTKRNKDGEPSTSKERREYLDRITSLPLVNDSHFMICIEFV